MAKLVVIAVLLGACVADDDTTVPTTTTHDVAAADSATLIEQDTTGTLCALASDLPSTDVCSLVCDPDGFKARLLDDGMTGGNCYQFRCNLSPEVTVTVGVCLP